MGDSISEGELGTWFVEEGATVDVKPQKKKKKKKKKKSKMKKE
jgi:hypothetical protein